MADSELLARLDRITYLLVALFVLQLFHVFGGGIVRFSVLALLVLAVVFVGLVLLGLARTL